MFFDIIFLSTFRTRVTYKFCIFLSVFYIIEKYKIELFFTIFLEDVVNF